MEKSEANKLIVDFMGIKPDNTFEGIYSWSDAPFFYCSHNTAEKTMKSICSYVKYSSSYDWLVPVIDKLKSEVAEPEDLDELRDTMWWGTIEDVFWEAAGVIKGLNDGDIERNENEEDRA